MPRFRIPRATLLFLSVAACTTTDRSGTSAAATNDQAAHIQSVVEAGGVVDSILPIAEHLRRFRSGMVPLDSLQDASPSLPALVTRLTQALSVRDTAALNAMVLNRREFAYLYYPESTLSQPPYEAPPELLWGQILESSNQGAKQLMEQFGGADVTAKELSCPAPEIEGPIALYKRCTVVLSAPKRATLRGNLFGTIIARDGRFKFIGFANRI